MEFDSNLLSVANLVGEPARATMLWNLLDGRAYTAGELALVAEISPQSASNHLSKLVEAEFLTVEKQGKHRYYRFAKQEVAYLMEAMANLIPDKKSIRINKIPKNGEIGYCRTCYDHLAGKIAVDITASLLHQDFIKLNDDEFTLTAAGELFFEKLGVDVDEIKKAKRNFAKPCLDWTERKYHLAGALGAALLNVLKTNDWVRRKGNSRTMVLTAKGESELYRLGLCFKELTLVSA